MKPLALALALALFAEVAPAKLPTALDRVVAVFDKTPILLSEVRARVGPLLATLRTNAKKQPTEAEVADIHKQMLERMLDELVVAEEAKKLSITADDNEVKQAVVQLAASNNVGPEAIYAEAKRVGLTKEDYDAEVRRQILEAKWVQLRLRNKLTAAPADEKALYEQLENLRMKELDALRTHHYVEVRW